jgi:hypothetical protein
MTISAADERATALHQALVPLRERDPQLARQMVLGLDGHAPERSRFLELLQSPHRPAAGGGR